MQDDEPSKGIVIGILGVGPGDGASTVAAAIAACCSKDFGLGTVLVDADRTNQSVGRRFSLNGSPGLQQLMVGEDIALNDCLQSFEPFDLSLVSSTNSKNASLDAKSFSISKGISCLSELSNKFDIVVVDLPHASAADSAASMAPLLENIIVVVQSGKTRVEQAVNVLRKFDKSNSEICGVVLNKCKTTFPWQSS